MFGQGHYIFDKPYGLEIYPIKYQGKFLINIFRGF